MRRSRVSPEMWRSELVVEVRRALVPRLTNTVESVGDGRFQANTIGSRGFSLRVNSPNSGCGTVSLMAIRGGDSLMLPCRQHLEHYLPNHRGEAIDNYMELIASWGYDVDTGGLEVFPSQPLSRVRGTMIEDIREFARLVVVLATAPR